MNPRLKFERITKWLRRQLGEVRDVETKQARVEDLVAGAEYELGALRRELGMPPEPLSVQSDDRSEDEAAAADPIEEQARGRVRRSRRGQSRRKVAQKRGQQKQRDAVVVPRNEPAKSNSNAKPEPKPAARKRLIDRL